MWEWINGFTDDVEKKYIIEPGNKFLGETVTKFLKDVGIELWGWFVEALPDLVGFGTIAAGGFIMVGSMIGKGEMMRPMAYLSGGVIVALCILIGAKGA